MWKEELLALKIGKPEIGVVVFLVSLKTGIEDEFPWDVTSENPHRLRLCLSLLWPREGIRDDWNEHRKSNQDKNKRKEADCINDWLELGDSSLYQVWNITLRKLVQESGVDGHVLSSSWNSTEIATSSWTIIDRRTLEPTKKDTPI